MLNELEEFLRRAAQRALEAQQKQAGPPQPQPPTLRPQPAQQAKPIPRLTPQVEVVEAELLDQPNRVSQSVQQNLRSTQQISQHASQLGDKVAQADEAIDAHLHHSFDHQLGRLHKSAGGTTSQVAPSANDSSGAGIGAPGISSIAQLFTSLTSIRNAVILREILDRPADRWDE